MKTPRRFPGWVAVAIVFVAIAVPVYADAHSDATALFFQASAAANNAGFTAGERTSLVTKVLGVRAAIERGNENAANGSLDAFVNEVQALEQSGRLDSDTAAALLNSANALADEI